MKTQPAPVATEATKSDSACVLCGTDFSPSANSAANAAAALAKRLGARLDLLHVAALPTDPRTVEKLEAEAARLRQLGAEVKANVINGLPDEELVARAEARACQLMVVASLGKRATERWVLGSVSERAAERSPVPTLVVRDGASIEAWARGERPLKVFVAFNFTLTSDAALNWVKELQAIGACEVIVGYVDWPPEERTRLGGEGPLPLTGNPAHVQAVLERDLRVRAEGQLGTDSFRVRVEANWGRADVRLAEMAREEGADLVVVGSHQYRGFERMWHGSVSRGLLHGSVTNVVVVPLAAAHERGPSVARPVQRVLVSTDFSSWSNHAIPRAYSFVPRGGTVHLVHVIHPHALPGGEFMQSRHDTAFQGNHEELVKSCAAKLRTLIPAEAEGLGVRTEVTVIEHRDTATGIVQAAERLGADVICIGTHGRTGRLKTLLGSVAQHVMALSERPVLIVRPPRE
ncbi:MAG: universal stress protein [Opitutaceae bacterium]|nr:universal stress protein [Opitutaceae bacterium]